jgi:hypothetical protein
MGKITYISLSAAPSFAAVLLAICGTPIFLIIISTSKVSFPTIYVLIKRNYHIPQIGGPEPRF